ncbi:MAG: hypothetical protein MUF84_07445, partial [Anaerolineae bacterium]|nr:hypothetical protein [Anaerolineae bacterium]
MTRHPPQRVIRYLLEGAAVLLIALLASVAAAMHVSRPPIRYSQETATLGVTVRARVEQVLDESQYQDADGLIAVAQTLVVRVLSKGDHEGEVVTLEYNGSGPTLSA